MTEYSRMAKGSYTVASGTLGSVVPPAKFINLPFQPDAVEFYNYTEAATPAQYGVPYAYWEANMGQGFAQIQAYASGPVLTTDVVTSNGISTFSAGLLLQYGPKKQVVASTKGTTTSFEVTAHGYQVGDTVIFEGLYQSATTGMPQMCGMMFTISTITDANNFIVQFNSNNSSYTDLATSPSGAYVKKVLYPFLYVPQVSTIAAISTGTTTTVTCTNYHNLVVGQEIAFRIPSAWGTVELNSLPDTLIPGSPIYGYVTSITNNWTFVCSINSTNFTSFLTDIAVSKVPGLTFPQVLSVGDVNMGGVQISSGSQLYPPPSVSGVNTINGPAIQGAYMNNTRQGFVIESGLGATTSADLGGASGDVIYWRAFLHDIQS